MKDKVRDKKKVNYKEIFDAFPESIIILDTKFSVLDMNDNAETIFRISRQKAQGRTSNLFMPIELEQLAKRSLEEERTIFGDEINPTLRSGDKIYIQAIVSPLFSNYGNIEGIILQIKDMTATKFLSSKSIQEISTSRFEILMSGLAHELKNPLSGIRGAAQLLADETANKETIKCAEIITKEADRLSSLLDSMKRLEPVAEEILEPLDIHDILMEIIYLESLSDTQKNIQYKQNYDITLPPVQGDRNSLKQVFLNLIKNASQAIQGEGQIEVSTRWITEHKLKGQKAVSVDIEDNGNGIARDSLEKIFSPFYTTRQEGTGLGLFLAYQIIAKHGGAILVESELGKGSLFTVYLPVSTN